MHPELPEIIRLGRKNGFSIGVFTNGLWPGPIQEYFRKNKDDKVVFLFNVNEPSKQKPMENSRQLQSLKIAGRQATLGFNIYHEDFNLLFVEELIISLSLKRKVRLGLASPIVKAKNAYLEISALKRVGKRLVQQLCELEKKDILGSLDCGFPLCMFDESDLGSLSLTLQSGFRSRCQPILDVDADLSVWPCYPLCEIMNVSLKDFRDRDELVKYYSKKLAALRNIGSMNECMTCKYLRRGQCSGGCFGRTLKSFEESGDPRLLEKLSRNSQI